jgi:hypothetical protein
MTAQIATALGPALDEPVALQQPSTVHVSEGSKAADSSRLQHIRFSSETGHWSGIFGRRDTYPYLDHLAAKAMIRSSASRSAATILSMPAAMPS